MTIEDVWEEWKRLTRFLECSKIAFQRELSLWSGLEVADLKSVRISTHNGHSRFSLTADEHLETLSDDDLLFFVVLTYSYSLSECYARVKLGLGEGARLHGGIECWGQDLLAATGNKWPDVLGGRAGLIEVAIARSFLAHGSRSIGQSTLDRFACANEVCPWALGDTVSLSYGKAEEYRSRLKSLMRLGNK